MMNLMQDIYRTGMPTADHAPSSLMLAGKADEVVKAVMLRIRSMVAPHTMRPVLGMDTPFSQPEFNMGAALDEPVEHEMAPGDNLEDAFEDGLDMTPPPPESGPNPFDPTEPSDPFAAPSPGPQIPITAETSGPLLRAVQPTFDTYSRFGYPDLGTDPHGQNLIKALRKMVRGAQA